ncbi:uncharacterized protein V6R79_025648 [Siganus canaliculatus]
METVSVDKLYILSMISERKWVYSLLNKKRRNMSNWRWNTEPQCGPHPQFNLLLREDQEVRKQSKCRLKGFHYLIRHDPKLKQRQQQPRPEGTETERNKDLDNLSPTKTE